MRCVQRRPSSIRVVSPFIGDLPAFRNVVNFSREMLRYGNCSLQIVTQPPQDRKETLSFIQADSLVVLGVDLLIRTSPWLHSKIYHFKFQDGDETAFVGSANFTLGGFDRNDETMAMMRDSIDNALVRSELERLSGRGSVPYHNWKALSEDNKRRFKRG